MLLYTIQSFQIHSNTHLLCIMSEMTEEQYPLIFPITCQAGENFVVEGYQDMNTGKYIIQSISHKIFGILFHIPSLREESAHDLAEAVPIIQLCNACINPITGIRGKCLIQEFFNK